MIELLEITADFTHRKSLDKNLYHHLILLIWSVTLFGAELTCLGKRETQPLKTIKSEHHGKTQKNTIIHKKRQRVQKSYKGCQTSKKRRKKKNLTFVLGVCSRFSTSETVKWQRAQSFMSDTSFGGDHSGK